MPAKFYLLILFTFTVVSCKDGSVKHDTRYRPGKDEMIHINSYFVQKDRERIQNYIERKNLKMQETATGLWYGLISEGEGYNLKENDKVVFDYECSLLDGKKCYSSKELGPKEIVLGKSDIVAGLDEGIRLLKPGGVAIFIIPPFLAYGLIGDGQKIPSRSTLVYNIAIISD